MFYSPFFSLPSASVIPEVHCLISPHQCLPPQGPFDLLIGSCDQTYGGTKHRPQSSQDKSRLIVPPPSPLFVHAEAEHRRRRRGPPLPLDGASDKQIHPLVHKTPSDINSVRIIYLYSRLTSIWFNNNIYWKYIYIYIYTYIFIS